MRESDATAIPQAYVAAGLANLWREPSYFREFRHQSHPIFPDSNEVLDPNNRILRRLRAEVSTPEQEESVVAELVLLARLSRHPNFLVLDGFTIEGMGSPNHYRMNILLKYGGSSLSTQLTKRQKRNNPIITEQQLWKYLWHLSCSLAALQEVGVRRYGHMMFYSIREIEGRLKFLYNPTAPKCLEIAQHQLAEYYIFFLSPQELAVLRNEEEERRLTLQSDVYSAGMMLLNMATVVDQENYCYSKVAYNKSGLDETNFNMKMEYFGAYYSQKLFSLLKEMLKEHSNERPTPRVLNHRVETAMRADLLKRQKYLNMLAANPSDSQLSRVSYDLPADNESVKALLKKMKTEKSASKKKGKQPSPPRQHEPVAINYRGTFGADRQQRKSPQDDYRVTSKISAQLRMLEPPEDDEDIRQNRQVPQPTVVVGSERAHKGREPLPGTIMHKNKPKTDPVDDIKGNPPLSSTNSVQNKTQIQQPAPPEKIVTSPPHQSPPPAPQEPIPTLEQHRYTFKPEAYVEVVPSAPQLSQKQVVQPPAPPPEESPKKPAAYEQSSTFPKEIPESTLLALQQSPIEKIFSSRVEAPSKIHQSPSAETFYIQTPQLTSPKRSTLASSRIELKTLEQLMEQFTTPGVYINGNCYYGPIRNGRRNGKGLQLFPNNEYYYGWFENDLFHGEGLYYWSKTQYFKGKFYQGSKKEGVMVVNQRHYEGEFKNNRRHGQGKAHYGNQNYEGQWEDGRKHGSGTMWYEGGDVYTGDWYHGMRSGKGLLQTKHFKIVGEWKNDDLTGYAEVTYSNGDIYLGQYRDSMKTGTARYFFRDGSKFEGLFEFDRMVRGKMLYSDGSIYEGEFSADARRHGRGIYKYPNGQSYDGDWEKGQKHGYGIKITHQQTYQGDWRSNLRHGRGTIINNLTGRRRNVVMENDHEKQL